MKPILPPGESPMRLLDFFTMLVKRFLRKDKQPKGFLRKDKYPQPPFKSEGSNNEGMGRSNPAQPERMMTRAESRACEEHAEHMQNKVDNYAKEVSAFKSKSKLKANQTKLNRKRKSKPFVSKKRIVSKKVCFRMAADNKLKLNRARMSRREGRLPSGAGTIRPLPGFTGMRAGNPPGRRK